MAFNPAPSHWIASFSEDGTLISVPIASFPELTAAEADGTTGDIRKVAYAFCEKLNAQFVAEGANVPVRMQIGKNTAYNAQTGQITASYVFTFTLATALTDVAAEPA